MSVMIVTSVGDIVIDLRTDRCPLTTKNFLKLCKIKYYNGCLFHTVQKDFTAQTGDPTGNGAGGDSIYKFLYGDQARFFGDEIHPDLKHSKMGTVAMASAGENLNASQFYFTLRDDIDYLDGKHTVFGEVAEGLDTLARINEAYVDEKERPYKNIRIKHTYILDDPFDDPPQLAELIPDASPEGKPKDEIDDDVRLEDDWVPMDEQLGPSELEEMLREKEAHSRAVVLESIGDIPEAEIKPPENVLFVCKLNPVTEDEDLNTIFSRFGHVVSAEIIRDFKTGDSLCYAFIEFENVEACEQAYFKMDNALIDDRRIHVDFSQSVAKLWSQYRRKENQASKGKGCFKCGALDHIAKECSGDPSTKTQPPKYILKEENIQIGGNGNSRYEMVFDGDTPLSSEQGKRHQESEPEDIIQKLDKRSTEDMKQRNREKRDYRDKYSHERKSYEEDVRSHESRRSGSRRDERYHGEVHREGRDKSDSGSRRDERYHGEGHREGREKRDSGSRRDERFPGKGHGGEGKDSGSGRGERYPGEGHGGEGRDKRDSGSGRGERYPGEGHGGEERDKRDARDHRRTESHRDRNTEGDYKRTPYNDSNGDKGQDHVSRKRSLHSDRDPSYDKRHRDEKRR